MYLYVIVDLISGTIWPSSAGSPLNLLPYTFTMLTVSRYLCRICHVLSLLYYWYFADIFSYGTTELSAGPPNLSDFPVLDKSGELIGCDSSLASLTCTSLTQPLHPSCLLQGWQSLFPDTGMDIRGWCQPASTLVSGTHYCIHNPGTLWGSRQIIWWKTFKNYSIK